MFVSPYVVVPLRLYWGGAPLEARPHWSSRVTGVSRPRSTRRTRTRPAPPAARGAGGRGRARRRERERESDMPHDFMTTAVQH